MLLLGSGMTLYQNSEVWALDRTLRAASGQFADARFAPDGRLLVTAGSDGLARIWDAAAGEERFALKGHDAAVNTAEFSSDGTRVLTAAADDTARVWNAQTGTEELRLAGTFHAARFSPDGSRIATVGDHRIAIWHLPDAAKPAFQLDVPRAYSVSIASDDRTVAATTRDNTVVVWDTETAQPPATVSWSTYEVAGAQYCREGLRIVTLGLGVVRLWDQEVEHAALRWRLPRLTAFALSDDGRQFVAICQDGSACVWDLQARRLSGFLIGAPDSVRAAAFSRDGLHIVTLTNDGSAQLWHRRRPDGRGGYVYLAEFWATIVLAAALTWSFALDAAAGIRAVIGGTRRVENQQRDASAP